MSRTVRTLEALQDAISRVPKIGSAGAIYEKELIEVLSDALNTIKWLTDEGPVILSAGENTDDAGQDLNRKVRDEIYRQLSGHYGDFNVPTQKEAQAVIDAVAGHLLNAVPDDSADDVREALGL